MELYLPVFLSTLHERQALVDLSFHFTNMGYSVDRPGVIRSQSKTLHTRAEQFEGRRSDANPQNAFFRTPERKMTAQK